jgi:DNA (cytosine-5)-methyltransferase 1
MYKIVSTFSGAGGLDYGFEKTGLFQTMLAIENQSLFSDTYKVNRRLGHLSATKLIESDIRDVNFKNEWKTVCPKELNPDGLIGGPPCESFSVRGNRKGVGDERGTLVYKFMECVQELKPRFFLMENVKQLGTQDGGKIFLGLIDKAEQLGYRTTYKIVKSCDYGAATIRERLIFIGVQEGEYIFPNSTHGKGLLPVVTVGDVFKGLNEAKKKPPGQPQGHIMINHTPPVIERFKKLKPGKECPIRKRVRLRNDKPSQTLYAGNLQGTRWHIHPTLPREITNREAARIHGFPDDYVFCGGHAAMAKQIANSVPIPVASSLAHSLGVFLDENNES